MKRVALSRRVNGIPVGHSRGIRDSVLSRLARKSAMYPSTQKNTAAGGGKTVVGYYSFFKRVRDFILLQRFRDTLPEGDLVALQRFRLLKITMLFAVIVYGGTLVQIISANSGNVTVISTFSILFGAIFVNYFALAFHRNERNTYIIVVALSYAILHLLSYGQGGVRNSGIIFLAVIIFGAFMYFGRTGGMIMAAISLLHLVYFFIITSRTDWVDYSLIGNDNIAINFDFLITGIVAICLLSGQANYIEQTNNAVIKDVRFKRDELVQKNRQLLAAKRELQASNNEFKQKNKELEQFAYVASHDLQEPLRTVTSFANLLQKQYRGNLDQRADKYLSFINEASQRMQLLITDLLEFSRLGAKMELMEVDCNEVVSEVLADLGSAIGETGSVVRTWPMPIIQGYRVECKLLFQNLLMNAIKFRSHERPPLIEIKAVAREADWLFSISDNGIGIAKEYFDRIFIIFQRLHTRNQYLGSGIGLSHCKKIVELHKGKVWLESEPGQGTTFYFTIPNHNKHATAHQLHHGH